MDRNLLKYRAFVATVEDGSFTRAAERLHYSQSGISRMIADLELEWNLTLLEKGAKAEIAALFERYHLQPNVHFTTWDDYAVMSMVEGGLGISILPELILMRVPYRIAIRELEQEVGLALSKTASSVVSRTLLDARGQMSAKSMHPPAYGQRKCQKKKGVQEKMKHLHKGGWCHPHSTRRLAFCRGCRIRQNTTPAKGALPGRLSPSTAALKTHRPRLRSAAMKAPVGLLSGRTVCDSRWRGFAPTSSTNVSELLRRKKQVEVVLLM